MPEHHHTQTLQKTGETQQVPFPERGDQNIMKDAQTQRQVQMIQKRPSEIHSKVQNMLMPRFQRSSSAIARSSAAGLEPTTDELGMRERDHEGSIQSIQWTVCRKEGRSQEASNEVATEFRDVGTPAQPCKRHNSTTAHNSAVCARDTAAQVERSQLTAVRMDAHHPTQRSRRRYLVCDCCPESEAAMKTLTS